MNEDVNRLPKFRFEDLQIWRLAMEIAEMLFDIADELEKRRLYRFAEQLRGAGISMPNNIAEGSGSVSRKEFIRFLNIARGSAFENANMVIMLARRQLLSEESKNDILPKLDILCRQITSFQKALR